MKRKTIPLLLVIFLLSGQTSWAVAQTGPLNNWTAVQRIGTDEKVVVKQKDGKEVNGRMIDASETTLTIDRDGKPFAIPRADVQKVHVIEGKAQKGKWALIGAGAGAAAGAGIGAIKYSPDSDDSEIYIGIGMLFGIGAGAATGVLFGQSRRKRDLVYAVN